MPSNIYGLPNDELDRIRSRDGTCVYCHKTMLPTGSEGRDWKKMARELAEVVEMYSGEKDKKLVWAVDDS